MRQTRLAKERPEPKGSGRFTGRKYVWETYNASERGESPKRSTHPDLRPACGGSPVAIHVALM
jgi:hypothetical protein